MPDRMRRGKPKPGGRRRGGAEHAPQGPEERAQALLLRLETSGPHPVKAAEELDRLQGSLEREERLSDFRERIAELCAAWSELPLRAERAHAWLTLVGGFGLEEHADAVARLAEDPGLPGALRIHACRVLSALGGETAAAALLAVVLSNTDPQVRAAAADGLGELGDRSARPVLQTLLEEDLPRNVWTAVSAAVDRLR